MLKGETLIELTDVKTGKVERYKDTNMFTNTLPTALLCARNNSVVWYRIWQTFLGGIMCFDKALEESADNCFAPADATVIANGSYNRSEIRANPTMGIYNNNESVFDLENRMFKQVYDFDTSRGNGTIRSICLTDELGGILNFSNTQGTRYAEDIYKNTIRLCSILMNGAMAPLIIGGSHTEGLCAQLGIYKYCINKSPKYFTSSTKEFYLIALDIEKDISYWMGLQDSSTIVLRKIITHYQHISILDNPLLANDAYRYQDSYIYLNDITLPTTLGNSVGNANNLSWNVDITNNTLYICFIQTVEGVQSIKIIGINIETEEVSYYTLANNTSATPQISRYDGRGAYVHNGYLYIFATNDRVYKISITNATDVTQIQKNFNDSYTITRQGKFQYGINDRIFINGTRYTVVDEFYWIDECINGSTNKFELSRIPSFYDVSNNAAPYTIPVINMGTIPLVYRWGHSDDSDYGTNLALLCGALMTINNLSTPVTKTADKTMKITYTIYESDPQPEPETNPPEETE